LYHRTRRGSQRSVPPAFCLRIKGAAERGKGHKGFRKEEGQRRGLEQRCVREGNVKKNIRKTETLRNPDL